MSREILDSVWSASGIRLIGDGVPAGDVMAAQASLTHWNEWFPYWTGLGDTYERLAREAVAHGEPTDFLTSQGDALCDLAEVAGARDQVELLLHLGLAA